MRDTERLYKYDVELFSKESIYFYISGVSIKVQMDLIADMWLKSALNIISNNSTVVHF